MDEPRDGWYGQVKGSPSPPGQLVFVPVAEVIAMRQALEQAERSLAYVVDTLPLLHERAESDAACHMYPGMSIHWLQTSIGIARARIRRAQT